MAGVQMVRRLDSLLATAAGAVDAGSDPDAGHLRDLYPTGEEILRILQVDSGRTLSAANAGTPQPNWDDILAEEPGWVWLRAACGIPDLGLDAVLIALAPELDPRYEKVFAFLQQDPSQRQPTVHLVLSLLSTTLSDKITNRGLFDADGSLLDQRIIRLVPNPRGGTSLMSQIVTVDAQIVDVVLGLGGLDRRLRRFARLSRPRPPRDRAELPSALAALPTFGRDVTVRLYFHGAVGSGRQRAAAAVAAGLEDSLLVARLGEVNADSDGVDAVVGVFREATLHGAVLYLDEFDDFWERLGAHGRAEVCDCLVERHGITVLAGRRPWVPPAEASLGVVVIDFGMPEFAERRLEWQRATDAVPNTLTADDIDDLASRFRFTARRITDTVLTARNTAVLAAQGDSVITAKALFAAARQQSGHDLGALARKIEPTYIWDDLVLPEEQSEQLRELCLRLAHRHRVMGDWGFDRAISAGKGVTALFAGPPGTGKTMAAEVIARELGLDLYKMDLAAVVSKYIGETEKNLQRIFDAAADGNAILFFDEADALFGKRSAGAATPTTATPTSRSPTCCSGWSSTRAWRSWRPTFARTSTTRSRAGSSSSSISRSRRGGSATHLAGSLSGARPPRGRHRLRLSGSELSACRRQHHQRRTVCGVSCRCRAEAHRHGPSAARCPA